MMASVTFGGDDLRHRLPRQPHGHDDPVLPLARARSAAAALEGGGATRVRGKPLDGGTALVRALVACGVEDLFGVPAGKLGPFLRAVAAEPPNPPPRDASRGRRGVDGCGDVPWDGTPGGLLRRDGPGRAQPRRRTRHRAGERARRPRAHVGTTHPSRHGGARPHDGRRPVGADARDDEVERRRRRARGSPRARPHCSARGALRTARPRLPRAARRRARPIGGARAGRGRPSVRARGAARSARARCRARGRAAGARRAAGHRCRRRCGACRRRAGPQAAGRAARGRGHHDADGPRRGVERRPRVRRARRAGRQASPCSGRCGRPTSCSSRAAASRRGSGREVPRCWRRRASSK